MDDDWDLQAVVRGCTTTTATTNTPSTSSTTTTSSAVGFHSFPKFQPQQTLQNSNLLSFQDPFEPRNENTAPIEELCDLYKPFYYKPTTHTQTQTLSPQNVPVSPLSVLGGFQDLSSQQQQQIPKSVNAIATASNATPRTHTPRSKRRKNQMKRVCQVPAEGLASDMWSWRKYGQKPIKGSPYPRSYYKCSTAKGCLARKQVERNRSDPNTFIVAYTAEHNHNMPTHRNSLAGSTRLKPTTSDEPNKLIRSLPEKLESSGEEKDDRIEEEDDDDFGISDMPLDDDFFAGLDEELSRPGPARVDSFPDELLENGLFPWLANNVTTTAVDGV